MLNKEQIREILKNRIVEVDSLKIPHFSLLSDIEKAAKRVSEAIKNKEKILIIGDYDVDGVVSSSVVHKFLKEAGALFEVVIPNRFKDGYGITPQILKDKTFDLVITVDNGISAFEAAKYLKEINKDLIITDHHTPPKMLPQAYAVVNPKTSPNFPFKEICGAEVAWYLCAAIKHTMGLNIDLRKYLDEVAIATIADVMPLTHLNRTLVSMGIKRLNSAQSVFAKVLKEFFNRTFNSTDIAFQIAPRLNSAGRIDSAEIAYKFLVSENFSDAYLLFLELDKLNTQRKEIEKEIMESLNIGQEDDFLVLSGEFHEGVVGIVASRLVAKYKKPALVLSKTQEGYKGSGRSLGNVDIFELINSKGELLEKFGGHKMACGVSIKEENLQKLKEHLNKAVQKYEKEDFFIEDFVLGEIDFKEIDDELMQIIEEFEPYGEGNPKPKFISNAFVEAVENIKNNHYRLLLKNGDKFLQAVIFNYDGEFGRELRFKFTLVRDYYSNVQIMIEEIL
ncbi:MAG: single-stranded-DNA-specific exonuclease RecJ [Epsilonproteobacteria bacterium]|nr:single-stranded-DNA-specific exonuclease RecJ [Campylobacterota bacterium]